MIIQNVYKNSIIEKPKFTLSILIIILLSFGYFAKNFQLDASSDTLLLENDPDLKYLREVNTKYGSKDFLVLTYTPNENLLDPITLKILKDNLDTPTTVAIKGKTAWVLQAQFGHLFGDEKDIPPGPFEIIGIQYKPSILTKIKNLLDFKN